MSTQSPECSRSDGDRDDKRPIRRVKKKTGYDCEFVDPPPRQFQSECPICLQILREPHLISCCGYNFCAECIKRIEDDGKPCPLCNALDFNTMANKGLKRTLHEFHVCCPHRTQGCHWKGELGQLDKHLNFDPHPECQLEGCKFAQIQCLYCSEDIQRDMVFNHQLKHCPQRPYACEYCAQYKSTFREVTDTHWAECEYFLLPCPNKCTPFGASIQCKDLDHHVNEECPLTVVPCTLNHAGCKISLPRQDMTRHMKEEAVAHISLLADDNLRLRRQLLEKEDQMSRMVEELKIAQQKAIDAQHHRHQQEMRVYIEMQRDVVPVLIKMTGFEQLKKDNGTWYSRTFYTGLKAFQMCLRVDANGCADSDGHGSYVSVFTCLMHGMYTAQPRWPFHFTTTIQLVNQLEDKNHHTEVIRGDPTRPYIMNFTEAGSHCSVSHGWGKHQFICHSKLGLDQAKNCWYLKDDCLLFRIVSVKPNVP